MRIIPAIHLFLLPVAFTISLILFRVFYSGTLMYIFFVWNLFLAGVPFVLSTILAQVRNPNMRWLLFSGWLLFFPNALYIITDLVHLKERWPVPLWFDIVLIFSAIINGLLMAFVSLQQIEVFLRTKFNRNKTNVILFGCLFLSSFGIYMGRFLRMNSWDIVSDPLLLLSQVSHRFINPFDHPRTWAVTIVLTAFFTVFYFIIKKLPSLIIKETS